MMLPKKIVQVFSATTIIFLSACGGGGSGGGSDEPDSGDDPSPTIPAPTVSLSASASGVLPNNGFDLSWSSSDADQCQATGDWSGSRAADGNETIAQINADATFDLTCTNASGSASDSVTISLRAALVRYDAPSQNTDGTSLSDLAGFNIHYGNQSGNYTDMITVADGATLEQLVELPAAGTYFFAVSAFNDVGEESALSNESMRTVQ